MHPATTSKAHNKMKFPLPRKIFDQNVAVLGKTRSGKSTMLRGAVEDLLRRNMPVCIVDPKGDWWGLKLAPDGKGPGFPVVIFGGEHADVPINPLAGAHVAELFATGNRPCLVDLKGWMPGDRTKFWIDFSSSLFKHTKGLRWLVIDEAHNFAPKGKVLSPEAGVALHWSSRIASEGLGMGLHLMVASQRPQKVHNDVLTSCETLVAMKVLHPSDRDAVTEWLEGGGDPTLTKTILGSLRDLERGEGWAWSPEAKFGPERLQFPMFTTYDSFKPQDAKTVKRLKGWAAVDLDEVTKKLAAVVEEAKANDPTELRNQIVALQRDLNQALKSKAAPATPAAPVQPKGPSQRDIDALLASAEAAAMALGQHRGRVEYAKELLMKIKELEALGIKDLAKAIDRLAAAIEGETKRKEPKITGPARRVFVVPLEEASHAQPAAGVSVAARAPRPAVSRQDGPVNADISRPQQKILDALAWLESVGIEKSDRTRAAMLAGVSSKSSGFEKNVSTLSTKGLIQYPGSGEVQLTDAGRTIANAPSTPPTSADLQSAIRSKISGPQWTLLEQLIAVYPNGLSREDLAQAANVSALSSGFEKNVSTLSGFGFVRYPEKGHVAATELLFVER